LLISIKIVKRIMLENIVLIGLMGSGKTTIGKLLSQKFDLMLVDTDELIEKDAQMSINKIFSIHGEDFFRALESKVIERVSQSNGQIISTGGGAVENPINLNNLKSNGMIFYLKASPEVLYDRIKQNDSRPLLKNENPLLTLQNLLIKREKFYNQADYIIDTNTKNIDDIVKEIKLLSGGG